MVSTRKKRYQSRRLLSQLDEIDQNVIFGDAMKIERQNVLISSGFTECEFTVITNASKSLTKENAVDVLTLEECFTNRFDREKDNILIRLKI